MGSFLIVGVGEIIYFPLFRPDPPQKEKTKEKEKKKRKLAEYRRVAFRTKRETLKRGITPSVKIWILIHCNSRMQR